MRRDWKESIARLYGPLDVTFFGIYFKTLTVAGVPQGFVLGPLFFLVYGGLSGGAMMLGKLPVPGRPTIWITVGQGPTALTVGAGWGCLDIFTLTYPFSPLSPSLWETARYRLKYCLEGPLNPKQPTNHPCLCE